MKPTTEELIKTKEYLVCMVMPNKREYKSTLNMVIAKLQGRLDILEDIKECECDSVCPHVEDYHIEIEKIKNALLGEKLL